MIVVLLYLWLISIVIILFRFDVSVVLLVLIFLVGNGITRFMFMELIFVVVLAGV